MKKTSKQNHPIRESTGTELDDGNLSIKDMVMETNPSIRSLF